MLQGVAVQGGAGYARLGLAAKLRKMNFLVICIALAVAVYKGLLLLNFENLSSVFLFFQGKL